MQTTWNDAVIVITKSNQKSVTAYQVGIKQPYQRPNELGISYNKEIIFVQPKFRKAINITEDTALVLEYSSTQGTCSVLNGFNLQNFILLNEDTANRGIILDTLAGRHAAYQFILSHYIYLSELGEDSEIEEQLGNIEYSIRHYHENSFESLEALEVKINSVLNVFRNLFTNQDLD